MLGSKKSNRPGSDAISSRDVVSLPGPVFQSHREGSNGRNVQALPERSAVNSPQFLVQLIAQEHLLLDLMPSRLDPAAVADRYSQAAPDSYTVKLSRE